MRTYRTYRPKGWAHVDPAQLVEWFDGEPLFGLAAALVVSSTEHRPWNGAPRQLDDDFLRSGLFELICRGLQLNASLWRRLLRERAAEIERAKRNTRPQTDAAVCTLHSFNIPAGGLIPNPEIGDPE